MKPTDHDDGIPTHLSVAEAARVLGLTDKTLRGWADRGSLTFHQLNSRAKRYIHRDEIKALAGRMGITPDWFTILN
jgi:excisionase family DNA binding protein